MNELNKIINRINKLEITKYWDLEELLVCLVPQFQIEEMKENFKNLLEVMEVVVYELDNRPIKCFR